LGLERLAAKREVAQGKVAWVTVQASPQRAQVALASPQKARVVQVQEEVVAKAEGRRRVPWGSGFAGVRSQVEVRPSRRR